MFYKITTTLKHPVDNVDDLSKNSPRVAEAIFEESENDAFVQILAIDGLEVISLASIGLRTELHGEMESTVAEYYRRCGMDVETSLFEPLTVRNFIREVKVNSKFYEFDRPSKRKSRLITENDVFNDLLPTYSERFIDTNDSIIREKCADLKVLSLRRDMEKELERIQSSPNVKAQGHPVHYLMVSSQGRSAYDASCKLTYHLHEHQRLFHNHLIELGFMNRSSSFFSDIEPSSFSIKAS